MELISAIRTRRSEYHLIDPAPSSDEFIRILEWAAAAPDHGRLRPWRWILVRGHSRSALGASFATGCQENQSRHAAAHPLRAPLLATLVFCPHLEHRIPLWEQLASACCVANSMMLLLHDQGYVRWGAVEIGGTKVICLVGSDPDHIVAQTRIPTGEPVGTVTQVLAFFQQEVISGGPLAAIGIASFGPLELRRSHARYGFITASPKTGWSDVDLVGPIRSALGAPVGFDTDVNAAALGEGRWGATRGLDTFVYLTVGTGIGAGVVVRGRVLHGQGHPEMGHLSVPRQPGDTFAGDCPFHADCLEGMASGAAIAARWGRPAEQLDGDGLRASAALEAAYLAAGLRNIVYSIAPQRIVIGGGVAGLPRLFPLIRASFAETLAGYPGLAEHAADDFIVPAALGHLAGPAGALILAERAASQPRA